LWLTTTLTFEHKITFINSTTAGTPMMSGYLLQRDTQMSPLSSYYVVGGGGDATTTYGHVRATASSSTTPTISLTVYVSHNVGSAFFVCFFRVLL
jgi:hypothetical protein